MKFHDAFLRESQLAVESCYPPLTEYFLSDVGVGGWECGGIKTVFFWR